MNIKKSKRTVNKKLIMALVAYNEFDLIRLGKLCDRPVTNAALSMLLSGKPKYQSKRLIDQVSKLLTVFAIVDIANDIQALAEANTPDEILFPYEVGDA
jgi:hypothetical protein